MTDNTRQKIYLRAGSAPGFWSPPGQPSPNNRMTVGGRGQDTPDTMTGLGFTRTGESRLRDRVL